MISETGLLRPRLIDGATHCFFIRGHGGCSRWMNNPQNTNLRLVDVLTDVTVQARNNSLGQLTDFSSTVLEDLREFVN